MKNDNAVSPVIGVILMVAITVILASIIGVFVFGMSDNIQKTHVVAITMNRVNTTTVSTIFAGGQDAKMLKEIDFMVDGVNVTIPNGQYTLNGRSGIIPKSGSYIPVGTIVYIPANNPGHNEVVATGVFTDETTQIIGDYTI